MIIKNLTGKFKIKKAQLYWLRLLRSEGGSNQPVEGLARPLPNHSATRPL